MKSYNVLLAEKASIDLKQIAAYIARQLMEPDLAVNQIRRIHKAVLNLAELPYRNPLVQDELLAMQGFRFIMVDQYIVFYVVNEETLDVTVVRILYGKRNWQHLLYTIMD